MVFNLRTHGNRDETEAKIEGFRELWSEGMRGREPLWKVNDQAARLAELVSDAGDLKEAPLRRDVRSLGRLLGEVLKEQVGNDLFIAVEELRSLLIERRELHLTHEGLKEG